MSPKNFDTTSDSPSTRMPKCVVFDLEPTSHPHSAAATALNLLKDRRGQTLEFYPEVPALLQYLKDSNIHVAAASRTSAPDLAREALALLLLPPPASGPTSAEPQKAISFFQTMEIYPGSKLRHFREIKKRTGLEYEEMLFFDDESRNKEVEQLGVTMHLIRNGVNKAEWEKGLKEWRRRRGIA